LTEDAVAEMLTHANKPCRATMNEVTVVTSGGAMRRRYSLVSITPRA
jgi:hypothetical protein